MVYFLDFIKQSPSATYLVATKQFAEKRDAIAEYHDLMHKALDNPNDNYANCMIKTDEGVVVVNDIQGAFVSSTETEETQEESEE